MPVYDWLLHFHTTLMHQGGEICFTNMQINFTQTFCKPFCDWLIKEGGEFLLKVNFQYSDVHSETHLLIFFAFLCPKLFWMTSFLGGGRALWNHIMPCGVVYFQSAMLSALLIYYEFSPPSEFHHRYKALLPGSQRDSHSPKGSEFHTLWIQCPCAFPHPSCSRVRKTVPQTCDSILPKLFASHPVIS